MTDKIGNHCMQVAERKRPVSQQPVILNQAETQYKKHLIALFGQTHDTEAFIGIVSDELKRYNIHVWAYAPLETSDKIDSEIQLGTIDRNFINSYIDESLFKYDLVFQHIRCKETPIFQSDIEAWISEMCFSSHGTDGYKRILMRNRSFGMNDTYSMPIRSPIDGSLFNFCITSQGNCENRFRSGVDRHSRDLRVIALAMNEVGYKNHPEKFIEPIAHFKRIASSKPIEVLDMVVRQRMRHKDAAKLLGVHVNTINKHLISARTLLDAENNYYAYTKAQEIGYLK